MRLGEIEELLDARAQTHAEPLAAAERDQGVRKLVAAAERIRPGIHEAENSLHAIGRGQDQACEARRHHQEEPREPSTVHAAQEEDRGGDRRDHDEGAEVRLAQKQPADHEHHAEHGEKSPLETMHERELAHGVVGGVKDDEQLHEFGGLQVRKTEREPAPRAVDLASQSRNEQQDEKRDAEHEQPRRRPLPQPHGHLEHEHAGHHARGEEQRMPLEEVPGLPFGELARLGQRDRGRIHHNHAESEQQERRPQHTGVVFGGQRAARANASQHR